MITNEDFQKALNDFDSFRLSDRMSKMFNELNEYLEEWRLEQCSLLKDRIGEQRKPRAHEELSSLWEDFASRLKEELDEDVDDTCDSECAEDSAIKSIQLLPEGCQFVRLYPDESVPDPLIGYVCDSGSIWLMQERSCATCNNCTDIYLDYSGPYGFVCTKGKDVCSGCLGECDCYAGH